MIMNETIQSVHPTSNATLPETALFRSTRGRLIATRQVAPSDSGLIADLLAGLSAQSLFLRYCMPMPRMASEMVAREAARLGQAHSTRQLTVVALACVGGVEQVIAVAELARDASSPAVAEIAMVLAENAAVRRMVARSGAPYTAETRQGMTTIQIDLRGVNPPGRSCA